jgi:carbon starvation protein
MFEALFILTTIDAGTRIGRYLLQDLFGQSWKHFGKVRTFFNIVFFSAIISAAWGYLLYTGNVSTIWPLFGTANQMLAVIAFAIGTTFLLSMKKTKYIWITVVPLTFITVTTLSAAVLNIFENYLPQEKYLLAGISFILIVLVVFVLIESVIKWVKMIKEANNYK